MSTNEHAHTEWGVTRIAHAPLRGLVRFYQLAISPFRPACCKYYPTCSAYALQALETHGVIKGILLTGWRVARCNPLSHGGVDYPPLRGQWRAAPYHQMNDEELEEHWARLERDKGAQGHKCEEYV